MRPAAEIVIVGAGAAGLAAAHALTERGMDVVVLEAAARSGGRAWTDMFHGMPYDRGCHWLHSASRNPLRAAADRLGHRYESHERIPGGRLLYERGSGLVPEAKRSTWAQVMVGFDAIEAVGASGADIAAQDALPAELRHDPLVRHWLGLYTSADPADLSTLDFFSYIDTDEDWPVTDGYGALVQAATGAAVLPIERSTPVTAIAIERDGVRVTTVRGSLAARAVIVTVSTSVLARGTIRFTPALPVSLQEAVAACPLGHAEKIAFALDRPLDDLGPTTYADIIDPIGDTNPLTVTIHPGGRPLINGSVAGHFARDLCRAGTAAMLDFGREALVGAFGSGIRQRIVAETVTGWSLDPLIGGAYSYARPGRAALRAALAEPVAERLFFAGEAVSRHAFSTAHGAYETGLAAATAAAAIALTAR